MSNEEDEHDLEHKLLEVFFSSDTVLKDTKKWREEMMQRDMQPDQVFEWDE